jgi:maltose/moltooligosaccharide transporter
MLSSSVDEDSMGTSMGIFNMFIVIPQIIAAIGGINLLTSLIGDKPIFSMIIAGLALIIAGLFNLLINDKKTISN